MARGRVQATGAIRFIILLTGMHKRVWIYVTLQCQARLPAYREFELYLYAILADMFKSS